MLCDWNTDSKNTDGTCEFSLKTRWLLLQEEEEEDCLTFLKIGPPPVGLLVHANRGRNIVDARLHVKTPPSVSSQLLQSQILHPRRLLHVLLGSKLRCRHC